MSKAVVVLNADGSIINLITWRRAINLLSKGKAEVVEATKEVVKNYEGTKSFTVPAIIRLIKFISNVYRATVAFTKKNVLIRDKHTCSYCDSKDKLTIDHVIPSSKGGTSSWTNCVASCEPCNMKKGNKTLQEAKLTLKVKPRMPTLTEFLQAKVDLFGLDVFLKVKEKRS